jgi:hypothetical protein
MKNVSVAVLSMSLMGLSAGVVAAENIKPGLWEMTVKSDAMKSMPKIPPEQMEKMKQMGIHVPSMENGSMTTQVCISKAMAERDRPPEMDRKESGCQSKNFQRSGSDYSGDIVCDGPDLKGQGKVAGHFDGSEKFTSTYDFKGAVRGKPVSQHHESSGKWLSADCGDVKPMDELMPKK